MDRQALITRFEAELGRVNRPGIDKLMGYIRGVISIPPRQARNFTFPARADSCSTALTF